MYKKDTDILDNYAFHFLEDVENPFVQLTAIGREKRCSSGYYWENRERRPAWLFQYTLSGSGTVKINGQEQPVDEEKAFFLKLPGEESYYFDEKRSQAPWEFLFIMFECHGAERYCRQIERYLGQIFSLPRSHEAVRLLFEIHVMAGEGMVRNPFWLSSKTFEFLCLLCTDTIPGNEAGEGSSLGARAGDYIRKHYMNPIGISDAAAFLKVSQSHLSREFYRETGIKAIDYLTRARLDKAVDLLTATEKTIEEIAVECGFANANYFGKVFKKHMDMTPAQFREYVRREGYSKMQI
ncbi:MAG: AraC family transcriptional regulator [Lachnospiraceae bacterium]|nr:AraC family transcriptional regulator [Lachnospiraceae bacterium]